MDKVLDLWMTQLASQLHVLLVYLAGIIFALVYRRRYPRPCALTLLASGLLLVTAIGQPFVHLYLSLAQADLNLEPARLHWWLYMNAMVASWVRALAFALLLAAVFVGRPTAWGIPRLLLTGLLPAHGTDLNQHDRLALLIVQPPQQSRRPVRRPAAPFGLDQGTVGRS